MYFQIETLDTVKKVLIDNKPESFEDCVNYARLLWQENYSNTIQQLLYNFPSDQVSTNYNIDHIEGAFYHKGNNKFPQL